MSRRNKYGKRIFSIDKFLSIINIIALTFIAFIMLYPFWEILVKSFMTDKDILTSDSFWWPKEFQFEGYKMIFKDKTYNFGQAFINSVVVTVAVTIYQLVITTITSYALSKKTLPGRSFFNIFFKYSPYSFSFSFSYYPSILTAFIFATIASIAKEGLSY